MRGYYRRIHDGRMSFGGLRWCPCVGRRLNHVNCRIYTNCRWGVKVKVHAQTLKERDLSVPDPRSLRRLAERGQRFMPESMAEVLGHYFGMKADRVVKAFERK